MDSQSYLYTIQPAYCPHSKTVPPGDTCSQQSKMAVSGRGKDFVIPYLVVILAYLTCWLGRSKKFTGEIAVVPNCICAGIFGLEMCISVRCGV